ncbi:MAG: hypothetical protein ACP5PW_09060, partial [Candidatus Dormibacteria bacterium]
GHAGAQLDGGASTKRALNFQVLRPPAPPHPAPGRFALVMAAGAIALGLRRVGEPGPALVLLLIAVVSYAEVLAGELGALLRSPRGYWSALEPWRARLGVFAFSAATTVLAELAGGAGWRGVALPLTAIGALIALLWGAGIWARPWGAGWLEDGGAVWLLGPVSAVAASGALAALSGHGVAWSRPLAALQLALLGLGLLAYLILATRLLWRLRLGPPLRTLGPSYWIVAGVPALAAISFSLSATAARRPWPPAVGPLTMAGAALLGLAGALVPLPASLTVQRLRFRRQMAGQAPEYWAGVFPLAIIGLACLQVGADRGWLAIVARLALGLATAALGVDLGRAVLSRLLPSDGPQARQRAGPDRTQ